MSSAVKRKLVVCGGSGFLGSRICRAAISRCWDVISVSRSGEPEWSAVTSSPSAPRWSASVRWQRGNILQPASYAELLEGADAVVHSAGILLEADYKRVVGGQESLVDAARRLYSSARRGASANPLDERPGESAEPSREEKGQLTYELMNRDSAILLAREAAAHNVPTLVYISAAASPPLVPGRYLTSKRAAESAIATHFPALRSVFARPAFMYDASRPFTLPIAAAARAASVANGLVGGALTGLMGAGGLRPLKVDDVADAVVEAVEDERVKGVVDVEGLERLAGVAWRKGML